MNGATAAYQKSVALQSDDSADAYLNFGITLYNANKLIEAVAPLRKATELDPQNAESWYLLGVTLLGAAHQQERAKMESRILPGAIEAFQRAVQSDPQSRYGQQAKEALSELHVAQNSSTKVKPQQVP